MRRELTARPFLLLIAGFLIGLNFSGIAWIFGMGIVLGVLAKQRWFALLNAGIFLTLPITLLHPSTSTHLRLKEGLYKGSIVISSVPEYNSKGTFCLAEAGTGITVRFTSPDVLPISPGDTVDIEGVVTESKFMTLAAKTVLKIHRTGPWYWHWATDARLYSINRIKQLFGERDGSWVSALTVNFPAELTKDDKDVLRNSGTYHLVSASGFHVFVIATGLHLLLVQFGLRRHWQIGLIFAFLIFYCLLTGFHAPTLRSALMWMIGSSAYLLRRSPDALNALCLSALLWLCFFPEDAFTPSFQLSYVVTGALVIWFERRTQSGVSDFQSGLEASLVASLAAEPLAAWWFGRIVLISPISNILITAASSGVLILGFFSLIPVVGEVAVWVAKPLIWGMQSVVELTSKFPLFQFAPRATPPWLFAVYYLLLLLILVGRKPEFRDPLK